MENKKSNAKAIIIAAVALLVIVGGFFAFKYFKGEKPDSNAKTITVDVVVSADDVRTYTITTDGGYLIDAMKAKGLIKDEDMNAGFTNTVDGVTADSASEWWKITKDGVMTDYGVNEQVIADGEKYVFTLSGFDDFDELW